MLDGNARLNLATFVTTWMEPEAEKLMAVQAVLTEARRAKDGGATRYCMGAAWRSPKERDMPAVLAMVEGVKALGLETCMTLGMLSDSQAQALADARARAGMTDITDLDGLETHDCFTITEYMAIDHCGLTAPGESWKAVEEGRITRDGDFPINPSGGLIGLGHPVGATGVRMVLDCARQVTGQAGNYQIANAENMITFNVGGSTTTCASFVVGVGS